MKWYEDKVYHLMCEKAVEIQKLRKKWQWGDICEEYFRVRQNKPAAISLSVGGKRYKNEIWLPRQDQLQEMMITLNHYYKLHAFNIFAQNLSITQCSLYTSMEQLWLAFVMEEKYGKIWNGEDWIQKREIKMKKKKRKNISEKYVKGDSLEAFARYVMKEKYNKVWNGKDWITKGG